MLCIRHGESSPPPRPKKSNFAQLDLLKLAKTMSISANKNQSSSHLTVFVDLF